MIFPFDVNHVVTESNKAFGENKGQTILVIFVFGSLLLLVGSYYLLSIVLGFPIILTILIYVIALIITAILIFRFVIFDENEKKRESDSSDGDSFAKYMWLRADIQAHYDIGNECVNVYEFVNGSVMCILELRFGSNSTDKANATKRLNETLIQIANDNNLESRIIDTQENFRNSAEFRQFTKSMNSLDDKQAAKNLMIISDAIMEESYRQCNVDVVYVMLRTLNSYQHTDLEVALRQILGQIKTEVGAYRSIHFLELQELLEFYREFYGIAAIDLTMMRTVSLAEQITDEFNDVISVLQLKSQSSRIFSSADKVITEEINKLN